MPSPRRRNVAPTKKTSRISWISNHRRTVGLWFLMLGFLLVTFPTAYRTLRTSNQTLEPIRVDKNLLRATTTSELPLQIIIPSISIDLPIVEAKVVRGFWELSETTASHGVGSANPGEIGNTVIFAHARDELFGPLRNLKKDAIVYVMSKDRWFRYKVIETKLVDPNAIEVIAPTEDETLTLYTCSGFLDTKRLIVIAKPQRP